MWSADAEMVVMCVRPAREASTMQAARGNKANAGPKQEKNTMEKVTKPAGRERERLGWIKGSIDGN